MQDIWNSRELIENEALFIKIGSLEVKIGRTKQDWRLNWEYSKSIFLSEVSQANIFETTNKVVVIEKSLSKLEISPKLSILPFVVKPVSELVIGAKQGVRLFVSTPLWLWLSVDEHELLDLPCIEPKKTWSGDPLSGELCYSGKIPLAFEPTTMPYRAVTPVTIHNSGIEALKVVRFRLPIPRLSLFRSNDGNFWTSQVDIRLKDASKEVEVVVESDAPSYTQKAILVSNARIQSTNIVTRALESVFSHSLMVG